MRYLDQKLIWEQLDDKLQLLNPLLSMSMPAGWIKTLRKAIGMTTAQLAKRVGVNQSRVIQFEKSELEGSLKLSTVNKIAEGLDMQFVYGFVPKGTLENMVRNQAKRLALKRMERLDHTMRLEMQGLDDHQKAKALEEMVERILIEGDKQLWEI